MRILITFLFTTLCITASAQQLKFIPDSTVNGRIFLFDEDSVEKNLGDLMSKVDANAALPDIYFSNRNSTQYLRLIFFPGSTANSFSRFEISNQRPKHKIYRLKGFANFMPESKIKIGTQEKDIIKAKGNSYTKVRKGRGYILRYKITSEDKSDFLLRYNMPSFTEDFYIRNGKLYKLSYGFDYP
jgi:hypothetical protein